MVFLNGFFNLFLIVLVFIVSDANCVEFIREEQINKNLIVPISSGLVQGRLATTRLEKFPYFSFQGIPYALPPLRNLRFRAPKRLPKHGWNGILDATKPAPGCVEIMVRGRGNITLSGEEDCLYLNVYTPQLKGNQRLRPVMVWIYGGGFLEGNSNLYDPEYLIKENIVLVTFNYRLGLFGFLSTGDMAAPGNYALKDQNLVLKWVQKNIKNFGGDPSQVTIGGESAGASSILFHMQSPMSNGLFHKAITASGSSLCQFSVQQNPKEMAQYLGIHLGITTSNSNELIEQLRRVDIRDLMSGLRATTLWGLVQDALRSFPYSPSIEPQHKNAFITKNSYESLINGKFTKVPVLSSVNSNEILFFRPVLPMYTPLFALYDLSPSLLAPKSMNMETSEEKREMGLEVQNYYFRSKSFSSSSEEELYNYLNDDQFYRPIMKTNQLLSKYVPVYFYLFSYVGDLGYRALDETTDRSIKGVAHSEDVWYLWPKNFKLYPKNPSDRLTSQRLARLWGNFVKYANPTPNPDQLLNNIQLPPMNYNGTYLEIGDTVRLGHNFRKNNLDFWEGIYKKYARRPLNTY